MSSQSMQPFLLAQETVAHTKAVRCVAVLSAEVIVSGGLDGKVKVWTYDSESGALSLASTLDHHSPAFVQAICPRAGEPDKFYSSDKLGRIFLCAISGEVLQEYKHHSMPVSFLQDTEIAGTRYLVSGSWDATAVVWNAETGDVMHILSGHAHAVTAAVLGTASDGIGLWLLTGSQDGHLRMFDGARQLTVSEGAHDDIIRGIQLLPPSRAFPGAALSSSTSPAVSSPLDVNGGQIAVSVSNDMTVKVWSIFGATIVAERALFGHSAFIFDLCIRGDAMAASGSDDMTVRIWNIGEEGSECQEIPVGSTVWATRFIPESGDLLVAAENGSMYLYTQSEDRAMSESQRAMCRSQAEQAIAAVREKSGEHIDISKLPYEDERHTMRGKKAGQTTLFRRRDKDVAVAYMWNSAEWECVGEVVTDPADSGMSTKQFYSGDDFFPPGMYDWIFEVDVADDAPRKKLPFKRGDNSLVTAERFCTRENIGRGAVDQIVQFIRNNTGEAPVEAPPSQVPEDPVEDKNPQRPVVSSSHFPITDFILFDKPGKYDLIYPRLIQLNNELVGEPGHMDELEVSYLSALLSRLLQDKKLSPPTASSGSGEFRKCELDLVFNKLSTWPVDRILPVLDIIRLFMLHPQSTDYFKKLDGGWHYIALILRLSSASSPDNVQVMSLRVIANMFSLPTNRSAVIRRSKNILDMLRESEIWNRSCANVLTVASTVLLNYCIAIFNGHVLRQEELNICQLLSLMSEFGTKVPAETPSLEAVYRLLVGAGTVLSVRDDIRPKIEWIAELRGLEDDRITEAVRDILGN